MNGMRMNAFVGENEKQFGPFLEYFPIFPGNMMTAA